MIPRNLFDSDLEGFRDSVRKFLEKEAVPFHAQWEKDGQVSRELWTKGGEMGFLCPTAPVEYGGLGMSMVDQLAAWEELGRVTNALCWCFPEAQQWMF